MCAWILNVQIVLINRSETNDKSTFFQETGLICFKKTMRLINKSVFRFNKRPYFLTRGKGGISTFTTLSWHTSLLSFFVHENFSSHVSFGVKSGGGGWAPGVECQQPILLATVLKSQHVFTIVIVAAKRTSFFQTIHSKRGW